MPATPTSIQLPLTELEAFDLLSFGSQAIPSTPVRFGFQIDLQTHAGMSEIVFGLVNPAKPSRVQQPVGFGVRIHLDRGEIWDVVNDSGLVGWLEEPLGCTEGSDGKVLLSLEIERTGNALLPKLQIGGEEWLYPALRSIDALELTAVAGCTALPGRSSPAAEAFSNPSLWAEQV